MNPNHVYADLEGRRRLAEARHEAELARLAHLAQGERVPRVHLDLAQPLAHLKCRLLDLVVALGFAIERCAMPPARPVGQPR